MVKRRIEVSPGNFMEYEATVEHHKMMEGVEERVEGKQERDAAEIFTRIGQAKQFVRQNPLFYDKNGMWWMWDKKTYSWVISDEVDILNNIMKKMKIDTVSSKSRTEIINSLKQVGRLSVPKDIKPTWIQFKDTIVDIETGQEFMATPEYFVTNPIPWGLHGERFENTPNMDRIFEEWVGKDHVKLLYEILAYSLLPDYPIHRLFCFIGSGMNGKSCYLRLLRKFIGGNNVCSTELDTLLSSRFEVTRLHKKLVCMMGETNFNEMDKTSIIKKLTGQDVIGFEYKNKNPFEEVNYAKVLIATNNLPTTSDKTIGFYRRWTIIDFPNQFHEKSDILSQIPDEEYESLALKSVAILKELLTSREFTNEGSINDRIEKYESKSNFINAFLKEFTENSYEGYITKNDFKKKFAEWCVENRHRQMSETSLGIAMKKMGVESGKKYFDYLYDGKGGQARVWEGIKWK